MGGHTQSAGDIMAYRIPSKPIELLPTAALYRQYGSRQAEKNIVGGFRRNTGDCCRIPQHVDACVVLLVNAEIVEDVGPAEGPELTMQGNRMYLS